MTGWHPVAALAVLLAGCGRPASRLPAFGPVPEFTLTAQSGAEFQSRAELSGRIWVADFIFTSCTGPCPRMSSHMRQVQTAVARWPDVRLVSFTVDPARDTPEALRAYATRYQADPARWFLLTGARDTLHQLNRDAFKLGNVDGSLDHSTRFVLIDRKSQVRGYYLTSEPEAIRHLIADIARLRKEPA